MQVASPGPPSRVSSLSQSLVLAVAAGQGIVAVEPEPVALAADQTVDVTLVGPAPGRPRPPHLAQNARSLLGEGHRPD